LLAYRIPIIISTTEPATVNEENVKPSIPKMRFVAG